VRSRVAKRTPPCERQPRGFAADVRAPKASIGPLVLTEGEDRVPRGEDELLRSTSVGASLCSTLRGGPGCDVDFGSHARRIVASNPVALSASIGGGLCDGRLNWRRTKRTRKGRPQLRWWSVRRRVRGTRLTASFGLEAKDFRPESLPGSTPGGPQRTTTTGYTGCFLRDRKSWGPVGRRRGTPEADGGGHHRVIGQACLCATPSSKSTYGRAELSAETRSEDPADSARCS